MKAPATRVCLFLLCALFAPFPAANAGVWSDHFSSQSLLLDWTGDRDYFSISTNELNGRSVSPLAPAPFHFVEIQTDSTDCSVSAWINVISPNLAVCTKGALLLRHSGEEGYVFALHQATQTVEVYRLSNHEMLLNKPWKIDLRNWYFARAELHGPQMTFYVGGELVGTVTDSASPSGAIGLAVQDAMAVLFDDFTVSGPNVVGNIDNVSQPQVASLEPSSQGVTLRFIAEAPYDYFVQVTSIAAFSHDWETIASYRAKLENFEVVFTDTNANTNEVRFYRIEKVPCYCR